MKDDRGLESDQIHASMTSLLSEATKQLAVFLEKVLPSIFDDWWEQAVLNGLSFQQRRRMKQRNFGTLASLDLAALLRVLDQPSAVHGCHSASQAGQHGMVIMSFTKTSPVRMSPLRPATTDHIDRAATELNYFADKTAYHPF